MRCTCVTLATNHIEVLLIVNNVFVHRERFTNPEDAARFALDKMRAYSAP